MAYSGSTAASSLANPPINITSAFSRTVSVSTVPLGRSLWMYSSTDSTTLALGANYFTDAYYLGMRQGDVVINTWQSSAGSSQVMQIAMVGAVTTNGAALTTGSMLSSTTP